MMPSFSTIPFSSISSLKAISTCPEEASIPSSLEGSAPSWLEKLKSAVCPTEYSCYLERVLRTNLSCLLGDAWLEPLSWFCS